MDKFFISHGEVGGSKQVIFYFASKVTLAELNEMCGREFPGIDPSTLNLIPGIVCLTVTTGKDLEIPKQ